MASEFRTQQASRLRKTALDLYDFVGSPERYDRDQYLTAIAHLMDVTALEVESTVAQLKRSVGGMSAKIDMLDKKVSELESETEALRAKLDRLRNNQSPAKGMASGYDC